MQHFLVPTDFSETAFSALRYAAALAQRMKASITILHIYIDAAQETQITEQLAKLRNDLLLLDSYSKNDIQNDTESIDIRLLSLSGNFMEVLKTVIDEKQSHENGFSLIIMGMKGLRSINTTWLGLRELESVENFWVGSHTTKVLEAIKIPIIIVPKAAKFHSLQQITLAIDTKRDYTPEIFTPLAEIADFFDSNLSIISIRLRDDKKDEDNEELKLKKVRKWIGRQIHCSFKIVIADSVQEGLSYYVSQENNEDLLVMVTRKKGFFERVFGTSATQQMVYSTTMPVLVLHNQSVV